ncbi:zinc finger matrin-type protein CG9776 isoform X1 [Drosophila elegans]|uniref:zinc finger matrin-type protein CG9776 isoform X1 n=2 Tax=Drosophila elegans TaxID=30023 RepID=UPI0007E67833|nr:zinc finger matrin-type protein CG9776 isoform X1 [Drosophila elegans]
MDEDSAPKQPSDRRLANAVDLPPGPPGVEEKSGNGKSETRGSASGKGGKSSSRRRSTSRGRSDSRNATSPPATRRRRSISRSPTPPRRGRYDSPDYDRYPRRRFDRRRSPPRRNRRYGRSRSRSISPRRGGRWSPKKKPASPPMPPQQMAPAYGVMAPQMYDPYGAPPDVYGHQYGMPPNAFPPQGPPSGYGMPVPPEQSTFAPGYGPPPTGAWGVSEYGQQMWMTQTMGGVQVHPSAPDGMVQPQQALEAPPEKQLEEDQKVPALDGAGLPPQDALAQEAEKQKDELKKQRANYVKKVTLLKKEMKVLREQREDLTAGEAPPSPTTKTFISENDRLQIQIKKKLDTIENVIDMLNSLIGSDHEDEPLKSKAHGKPQSEQQGSRSHSSSESSADSSDSSASSSSSTDSSSDGEDEEETGGAEGSPTNRLKHRAIKSMKSKQKCGETKPMPTPAQNNNFVFFDPELHWCESCGVFPKTARDYLKHLHAEEHMNRETIETPWHVGIDHDPFPTFENAPVKRVPVRGMQFLVPANAWFCKLCSVWIGDLHCASAHLKSRLHSNKYEQFIAQNPNYETEWQANRERAMNQQKELDDSKNKKSKKDDDKASKKRKKKSGDKKKKKRKHGKKSKRNALDANSSSSSSDSSSSEDEKPQQPKKGRTEEPASGQAEKSINAASIRVTMRKHETSLAASSKPEVPFQSPAPPPPPVIKDAMNASGRGKWTSASGEDQKEEQKKRDDVMLKQWNTVQPVISESEKKLLEQLKGRLKNKGPRESEDRKATPHAAFAADEKSKRSGGRRSRSRSRSLSRSKRRSRSRSISRGRDRDRDRRDRDRERDRDRGRRGRRSRSRGRHYSRSPLRSSRRSRSREGRSRRSRSRSDERVERPVIKHSEFRPRTVPERKQPDSKREKKDPDSKTKSKTSTTSLPGGKKLPFIGKMPVFKKQPVAAASYDAAAAVYTNGCLEAPPPPPPPPLGGTTTTTGQVAARQLAPTAAQIQMAMMEDAFGNAPPFHPDAGMMVDYDELMPDPVQFASLMTSCPPPPPPGEGSDGETHDSQDGEQRENENHEKDVLPPGIDEAESDLVAQPLDVAAPPRDGELPKDLAEALNIIFPSEGAAPEATTEKQSEPQTITTIVEDDAVLSEHSLHDLAKQGIHLVTIDEAEASKNAAMLKSKDDKESQILNGKSEAAGNLKQIEAEDIPMPSSPPASPPVADVVVDEAKSKVVQKQADISDIPQPPASPSDSEKLRRQAELDELAMLGIDSSDMAAQYAL